MLTQWWPNGQTIAQVDTLTVTAVATGGTLVCTINQKSISYTCLVSDTITTAATALLALLVATQANGPAEFAEVTFTSPSAGVILATAGTPGNPFTMTTSATGGAALSQVHTTANSSPSDVANQNNWLRGSFPGLPQSGDDIVIADSSVPLLWNLTALQAIQPASFTRWQSFTGTIGLPLINANGYQEYRPTDLTFGVSAGSSSAAAGTTCTVNLGVSDPSTGGTGPTRERYNFGTQQCAFSVFAAGSPQDDYSVALLNTNALSTLNVQGCSVGVAMVPGQAANLQSAQVDGGGTLSLGALVSLLGTLNFNNGSGGVVNCAPGGSLLLQNGSTVTVQAQSKVFSSVLAYQSSILTWLSNSNITTLVLQTGAVLDKSGDFRPVVIAASTIDGDTCQILDPLNAISYTTPTLVKNGVTSGPFTFTGPRTVQIV